MKNPSVALKSGPVQLGWFALSFALSKSVSFGVPLLLSNLIDDKNQYGTLEYEISLATWLVVPLSLGLTYAFPYFYLKKKTPQVSTALWGHLLVVFPVVAVAGYFLYRYQIIDGTQRWASVIALILLAQAFFSTLYKTQDRARRAVFFDSGIYYVLLLAVLAELLFQHELELGRLNELFGGVALCFFAAGAYRFFRERSQFNAETYRSVVRFGVPSLLLYFLTIGITNSARVWIEHYLSASDVAYFSFFFRLSGLIVVVQQVVTIVWFRKIYESDIAALDQRFSAFLTGAFFIGLLCFLCLPILAKPFFTLLQTGYETHRYLYFILTFQMLLWMINAINEGIILRENRVVQAIVGYVLVFALMLIGMQVLHGRGRLDLPTLCCVNLTAIFCANEVQFFLINQKTGGGYRRVRWVSRAVFAVFIAASWFLF